MGLAGDCVINMDESNLAYEIPQKQLSNVEGPARYPVKQQGRRVIAVLL